MIDLNKYTTDEGVVLLSPVRNDFENLYIKLREKERRVYSDEEVKHLPFANPSNPHKNEWQLRAKSFIRFKEYLQKKNENLNILDLGCGNCWFCGQLSKTLNHNYFCVDVNLFELKQGRRVFISNQLKVLYADIFTAQFPSSTFDLIIINSAIQYFSNMKNLIDRLISLIKENCEIHFIDSPFYNKPEIENAQKRTSDYYKNLGFPEMSNHYFHHSYDEISSYKYNLFYNPRSFKTKLSKIFRSNDSPFPWIVINK